MLKTVYEIACSSRPRESDSAFSDNLREFTNQPNINIGFIKDRFAQVPDLSSRLTNVNTQSSFQSVTKR